MIEVEGMCRLPNRDGVPRQVRVYCIPGEPDLGENGNEKNIRHNAHPIHNTSKAPVYFYQMIYQFTLQSLGSHWHGRHRVKIGELSEVGMGKKCQATDLWE